MKADMAKTNVLHSEKAISQQLASGREGMARDKYLSHKYEELSSTQSKITNTSCLMNGCSPDWH